MKITLLAMVLFAHVACAQQGVSSQFLAAPYPTEQKVVRQDTFLLWGTVGSGAMAPGIGGLLRLAYVWDGISGVSLKAAGAGDLGFIFGAVNYVEEYGIYYGRHSLSEFFMFRIAGGAAYFERGNHSEVFHRIGVGFEAEAMLKFKVIGIGLMFNYMLARDISLPGVTFNISLGKLE